MKNNFLKEIEKNSKNIFEKIYFFIAIIFFIALIIKIITIISFTKIIVIFSIFSFLFFLFSGKTKINLFLLKYKQEIFYSFFSLFFIVFIFSIFNKNFDILLEISFFITLFFYFLLKIFGLNIKFSTEKKPFISYVNIFIIFSSLIIIYIYKIYPDFFKLHSKKYYILGGLILGIFLIFFIFEKYLFKALNNKNLLADNIEEKDFEISGKLQKEKNKDFETSLQGQEENQEKIIEKNKDFETSLQGQEENQEKIIEKSKDSETSLQGQEKKNIEKNKDFEIASQGQKQEKIIENNYIVKEKNEIKTINSNINLEFKNNNSLEFENEESGKLDNNLGLKNSKKLELNNNKSIFGAYSILTFLTILILSGALYLKNNNNLEGEKNNILEKNEIKKEFVGETLEEKLKKLSEKKSKKILVKNPSIKEENKKNLKKIVEKKVKIKDYYNFRINLYPWTKNKGLEIKKLKLVLQKLGYFSGKIDSNYDKNLINSMKKILIEKCGWPENIKGYFGPKARECINNLEIKK